MYERDRERDIQACWISEDVCVCVQGGMFYGHSNRIYFGADRRDFRLSPVSSMANKNDLRKFSEIMDWCCIEYFNSFSYVM